MTVTLFDDSRHRVEVAPRAVHLPGWLSVAQQQRLVASCEQWAVGPVPMRSPKVRSGYLMSVKTVSLGWHWQPYRYTRVASDVNGQEVAPFPKWLSDIARAVAGEAYGPDAATAYWPDAALINFYDDVAKMGMHQDKDELVNDPVVSLSVGDSCTFRFGNVNNRNRPYRDVVLASGDAFVFAGPSRLAFHGVTKVHPGTARAECGLAHGRINITMRVTGLT
jgi:alkylated DNA repair protein (DNA oxidative demethylase)